MALGRRLGVPGERHTQRQADRAPMMDMADGAERVPQGMSDTGPCAIDRHAGEAGRNQHAAAGREIVGRIDGSLQVPGNQPDRLEAGGVVQRIGAADGDRLDRMNKGIDAGRRGERRRKLHAQGRIEQCEIGLELGPPGPDLRAGAVGEDRCAGRLRPGPGRGRNADARKAFRRQRIDGELIVLGRRRRCGDGGGELGRIERRPTADADDGACAFPPGHCRRRVDLGAQRLAPDIAEHQDGMTGGRKQPLDPPGDARLDQPGIGDEKDTGSRAGEPLHVLADALDAIGAEGDARAGLGRESGNGHEAIGYSRIVAPAHGKLAVCRRSPACPYCSGSPAMKIERIEVSHHRLPLDPPFRPSWDSVPRTRFDATIVRVTSDEGHVGIGSGDTMLGLAGHEQLFVGKDPLALEQHYRLLANLQFHYGRCWPLDVALWDLAGKIVGQPVWKLLGGLSNRILAYASSGTLRDPQQMAEAATRYREAGFKALKIRFHAAELARRHRHRRGDPRCGRRRIHADGGLQSGLAHALGYGRPLVAQGRAAGRPRAGRAGDLLDGGAAPSRRHRGHGGAAVGDRSARGGRRDDPRAARIPRPPRPKDASTCCSRMWCWSAASPGCGGWR